MPASLVPDEHGLVTLGGMRLGMVQLSSLEKRRANPRAMAPKELQALRKSVERFGFKSFVVVEELSPGRFGIVDGHHRVQVATESGMSTVPVVLLDSGTEKQWADLAMLTFNVTGEPGGDPFIEMLSELTRDLGADVLSEYTAIDNKFLSTFLQDIEKISMLDVQVDVVEAPSGDSADSALYQGRARVIELPRSAEADAVLDAVVRLTGDPVVGQAVLAALKEWVSLKE